MPVELNDLVLKRTRALSVPIPGADGEAIRVEWNPTNMTRPVFARLQEWRRSAKAQVEAGQFDPFEVADRLIVPLVTAWDITDGGKPYPITTETVAGLGLDFVMSIAAALDADQGDQGAKKDSGAS